MTTTPPPPTPLQLARRRRHARLIAALTNLIGACAEAAGEVYGPIAAAPPDQEAVEVQTLSCMRVAMSGPLLLDLARSEDTARWPDAAAQQEAASRRTYAARCALAEARTAATTDRARQPNCAWPPYPTSPSPSPSWLCSRERAALRHCFGRRLAVAAWPDCLRVSAAPGSAQGRSR